VRFPLSLVAGLANAGGGVEVDELLRANERIDWTIAIDLRTVAAPTPAFSSSSRKRVRRLGVSSRTP
jgi:hypothetical protein